MPNQTRTQRLAASIKADGLSVTEVVEPDDFEDVDGAITINPEIHVQIGSTYFNVVHEVSENEWIFGEERRSHKDVIADIRAILNREPTDN